ncbi:hypothetical protein B0H11DRAFT_1960122 [Mycena galericulata]|nr:hypothetical protein B0H11DRAFT_1960122 [Mycena galericulata]
MDLLKTHPELAPDILKLLSDSLTSERSKVKDLERKLAEQDASTTEASGIYSVRLSALEAENLLLRDVAHVKQEAVDSNLRANQSSEAVIARLEQEAATLRSQLQLETDSYRIALESSQRMYEECSDELKTCTIGLDRLQQQYTQEMCKGEELQDMMHAFRARSQEEIENLKLTCEDLRTLHDEALREKDLVVATHTRNLKVTCEELRTSHNEVLGERDLIATLRTDCEEAHERCRTALREKDDVVKATKEENASVFKALSEKLRKAEAEAAQSEFARERLADELCTKRLELDQSEVLLRKTQHEFEAERQNFLELQEANAAKHDTLVREYQEKAEKSSVEHDKQMQVAIEAQREELLQVTEKYEKQRRGYQAKLKEYKDKNTKLHRNFDSLKAQIKYNNDPANYVPGCAERSLYIKFMGTFAVPFNRPPLGNLPGIHRVVNPLDEFENNMPTTRKSVHFPMRQIWTGADFVHTLVFAPAEEHRGLVSTTSRPCIASLCGEECDLFVTGSGNFVYYAGTYMVHSLRHVHPPGSSIPSDIHPEAIQRGISTEFGNGSVPDLKLKTECFGLQCTGFDMELYQRLIQAWEEKTKKKRKAIAGQDQSEPQAKCLKTKQETAL